MSLEPELIFGPLFAMMTLVLVVSGLTLAERIRQFKAQRLHPQKVPTRGAFAAAIKDTRCADNFAYLFETPVMFYVVCVGLYVTQTVGPWGLGLAWVFVLLRVAHSHVHCGSNKVMIRFKLFAGSLTALSLLWLLWAWSLWA